MRVLLTAIITVTWFVAAILLQRTNTELRQENSSLREQVATSVKSTPTPQPSPWGWVKGKNDKEGYMEQPRSPEEVSIEIVTVDGKHWVVGQWEAKR